MDFRKTIAQEYSKAQVNRIVKYVGKDAKRFAALVKTYLEGPYRITQRAAWPLSSCVENHPELIGPHLKTILDQLKKTNVTNALKRNTMRLLQFIEIPVKYRGSIADKCFQYLEDKKEPVAIKVFAMTVLTKITEEEPELRKELTIILEDQLPYAKPAFVSRGRKMLKVLRGVV